VSTIPNPPPIRTIRPDELPTLLALYRHLHPSDPALPLCPNLESLWQRICADPHLLYFGAEVDGTLVSTCTLTVIPNLTRSARPYGLIENVVTHPDFRRRGIASSLLRHALQTAWGQNCYKVMLLTGCKDPDTLRFYEKSGFQAGVKTGFIATP
jgi:GNAT superfamily N-acetyltransferase